MFERYIICENSLRNMSEAGEICGFAVDVRIAYYRGLLLSMVEPFEVTVDGQTYPPESIVFQIGHHRFTFAQMEREGEVRWEFAEPATLIIKAPGGLSPGAHDITVVQSLRVSYMPQSARRADTKRETLAA